MKIVETFLTLDGIFSNYSNYAVSNFGNVKNLKTNKIMIGTIDKSDYHLVKLTGKNLKQCLRIHRLVCYMFKKETYNEKFVVNHIDGNRSNNNIDNLEWITQSENVSVNKIQPIFLEKRKSKMIELNKTILKERKMKKVLCIETNIMYESITDASIQTKICLSSISKCCLNQRKTAGGFKWKFVD